MYDKAQNKSKDWSTDKKDKGKFCVHINSKDKSEDEHHRTSGHGTKSIDDRILHDSDVGCHSCYERGCFKMVQICKRIALNLFVFLFTDIRPETKSSSRCKFGIEKSCDKREECADTHQDALYKNIVDVFFGNSHINNVSHDNGDDKFKRTFCRHKQDAENKFFPEFPKMGKDPF